MIESKNLTNKTQHEFTYSVATGRNGRIKQITIYHVTYDKDTFKTGTEQCYVQCSESGQTAKFLRIVGA